MGRLSKGAFPRVAGTVNTDADMPVNRCRNCPASIDHGMLTEQDDFTRRRRAGVLDLWASRHFTYRADSRI